MKYFIYVILLSVSFVSSGFCVERLFLGYVVGEGTIGELKYVTSLVERELLAVGGLSVMRPYDFGEREFVNFYGMGMEELGVASRSRWLVSGRSRIVGGEHEVVLSLHDVPGGGRVGQVEVRYGDIDEFRKKLHKSAYQFRCIMFDRDCVEANDLDEENDADEEEIINVVKNVKHISLAKEILSDDSNKHVIQDEAAEISWYKFWIMYVLMFYVFIRIICFFD
jgi:hypothetical protein